MATRAAQDVSLMRIIREKAKGTICVFERGEYAGIYDQDALIVAREIFRSEVGVKRIQIGQRRVPYITLGGGQYERVIRELLVVLRYRVQLYKSSGSNWVLKSQGSAGNMGDFEEIGELGKEATPVIAIYMTKKKRIHGRVSAALIDPSTLRITFADLEEDDKLSHLEQLILSSSARECIVLGDPSQDRLHLLKTILKRSNILSTCKTTSADKKALLRLLREEDKEKLSLLSENTGWCVCWVAQFVNLVQPGWTSQFRLIDYCNGRFMCLDAAAVKAFELFAPANKHGGDTKGTLFATLNKCATVAGRRLLKEWLARPLCDINLIEERLDCVEALIKATHERKSLHTMYLGKLPDLAFLSRRLLRKKARLLDCYRIAQAVKSLDKMKECVWRVTEAIPQCRASAKDLMLMPIAWGCEQFQGLVQCVQYIVDDSMLKSRGILRVKPEIDPVLEKLSEKLIEIEKRCKKALDRLNSSLSKGSVKLDVNAQLGYFYRVTTKDEGIIKEKANLRILEARKAGGVRFRDSILESLNEEYMEVNGEYQKAQKHLEETTLTVCASYAPSLAILSSQMAIVDVLVSFAVHATSGRCYSRPLLHEVGKSEYMISDCRHAVLDPVLLDKYIPNDIDLTNSRALIVTGANMGGKSTYLRSAALTSIMAQMGSFVPATKASISIQEAIHARVGASDCLSKGVSTFMSEMMECAKMINTATSNSLVIVDEIGRGTSAFDGYGLAWGITWELLNGVGCRLLVATHFNQLATMADPPRIRALEMKVHTHDSQLALMYKAEDGVAEASLGIHVARMVGINDQTLMRAEKEFNKLSEEEEKIEREKRMIKEANDDTIRQCILSATTF